MGLHNPFDRDFFMLGGSVKRTGGSLNLTKGQLALVDTRKPTKLGVAVLSTVAGKSKDAKDLELRLGVSKKSPDRSHTDKAQSTLPFSLNEVSDLRVSAPKLTEQTVDEVIIGYNGIDPNTAFDFRKGDTYFRMTVELSGDAIAFRGAASPMMGGKEATELVSVNVELPSCDPFATCVDCDTCEDIDCKAITLETIKRLKRKQLAGGVTVDQFVEITPVFECDVPVTATEIPYDYYCVSVCDSGTDAATALVAQQYNTAVIRTIRVGATSTYQILLPRTEGAPADYSQILASLIKGCPDCPSGYTATSEGFLYAFDMEDNGVDKSALIAAISGYVATTVTKEVGTQAGLGFYTAIFTTEISAADITNFLVSDPAAAGATIESLGEVAAICENGTVTDTAWSNCGTCNVVEDSYTLTLADTLCGEDRLAELNGAYEETVAFAESTTDSQSIVTLTGADGTADITIEGVIYEATAVTDLATTASNFDVAHSAALALLGITVTAVGDTLVFEGTNIAFTTLPTIVNTSDDIAGTVSALIPAPLKGACQTGYSITVVSNIVCDECDPIFKDFYETEAPESFDGVEWNLVGNPGVLPEGNCLCGIRFKGKPFVLKAEEALRDMVGFVETSTKVRVAAGYPEEIREGIGRIPTGTYQTTQISRWVERTHLAGNLRDMENESRAYFRGYDYKDYLGRVLRGETSNLEDQCVQYVHYTLTVNPSKHSQSFSQRISESIDYGVYVEVGRHAGVEALLNDIATHAGVKAVKAFG